MIVFVDMYCGCGGMSTGFHEACQELRLPYREIAINHWLRAIETMRANHPDVLALKMDIEAATSKDIGVKVIGRQAVRRSAPLAAKRDLEVR